MASSLSSGALRRGGHKIDPITNNTPPGFTVTPLCPSVPVIRSTFGSASIDSKYEELIANTDNEHILDELGQIMPNCHKTLFILDHTPYFGVSCERHVEFGVSRNLPGVIPPKPISKSLWTCSIEAAIEYSRVVWDLFPTGRRIRFILSDSKASILNSWDVSQQSIYWLLGCLSGYGAPPRLTARNATVDFSVVHGFHIAAEALCEYTSEQKKVAKVFAESDLEVPNNVRVICITSTRDDESISNLENILLTELEAINRTKACTSPKLLPVTHCHLVIINTHPNNGNPAVTGHTPKDISPLLTTEVFKIPAFNTLVTRLLHLLLKHYDLASTIVTGIPMKEEQNSSSSANYDVEIYHDKEAHLSLLNGSMVDLKKTVSVNDVGNYQMVTLNWGAPLNSADLIEFDSCCTLHRVTPVDINSRPSICLISFLFSGRSVMLDAPSVSGSRAATHVLTAFCGEIFMQILDGAFDMLKCVPPLDETYGGKVDDYRVDDLADMTDKCSLLPMKKRYKTLWCPENAYSLLPYERATDTIERETRFFPLRISETVIFNMREYLEPLLTLIKKSELTSEDVVMCKQCIYVLAHMDVCGEADFPGPWFVDKDKPIMRESQFKKMWQELIAYMTVHSITLNHQTVLTCLHDCLKKPEAVLALEKMEIENQLKEIEREREYLSHKGSMNKPLQKKINNCVDSPMSPPPLAQEELNFEKATPVVLSPSSSGNECAPCGTAESLGAEWYKKERFLCVADYLPPYRGLKRYERTPEGGYYSELFRHEITRSDSL